MILNMQETQNNLRNTDRHFSSISNFPILRISSFILFLLIVSSVISPASAQRNAAKIKLENKRKSLENEIQLSTKLLNETRTQKDQSLGELKLLQKQIGLREELLRQVNLGIREISNEIKETQELIETMEVDMVRIRTQYGKLVFSTYKAIRGNNQWLYILSANSLNQAQSRIRYFRELSRYHKSQVELIRRTRAYLERKRLDLEQSRLEKGVLLVKEKDEKDKLLYSKQAKDQLFSKLRKDESKFQQKIKEKQLALNKINKEIEDLITKEIKSSSGIADILLPLSKEFAENKGKMPWPLPTGKGMVTSQFGLVEDESGIQITNNGIDITTSEGQMIRAVFDGKVVQVQSIPTFGNVVIMQHGAFYTVYAHLGTVLVQDGQEIKKLADIGYAKTEKSTGETSVHFQIFQNKTPLNPETWLVNKK